MSDHDQMDQETPQELQGIVKGFFAQMAEDERLEFVFACAYHVDEDFDFIKSDREAIAWLEQFLTIEKEPQHRFSRLIHLIAILDFELSRHAVSRFAAHARRMASSDDKWVAEEGAQMIQERVPRLEKLVELWSDVRTRELNEAALWTYRDALQQQQVE